MSKINAIRLINLNYNNNAIRISDETFQLGGQSTLLSLRNGGGKSVLVQMISSLFVHKQYRKTKDRPFESYFTTAKPTFILVEWALDHGAGYCLTGMMVRKSQGMEEQVSEPLEMINFIAEYQARCEQDIYHIPVIEKGKKEIVLKSFHTCRQLFEAYKKERSIKFFYYDMNNYAQSRQYFDKLSEYQIYYKEWENIIRKVNLEESGLSKLFSDCKNEKELLEKWFLDVIQSKLNREQDRMKEFQTIIEKYVSMYKDNKSKIERRDTILKFKEDMLEIEEKANAYQQSELRVEEAKNKIACFIEELNRLEDLVNQKKKEIEERKTACEAEISRITYEKLSMETYQLADKLSFKISNRDMIQIEKDDLEEEIQKIEHIIHLYECAKQQEVVDEYQMDSETLAQRIDVYRKDEMELEPERKQLGGYLKGYFSESLIQTNVTLEGIQEEYQQVEQQKEEQKKKEEEYQKQIEELLVRIAECNTRIKNFDKIEDSFNDNYHEQFARNIVGDYEPGMLEIKKEEYEKQQMELARSCNQHVRQQSESDTRKKSCERKKEDLQNEKRNQEYDLRKLKDQEDDFGNQIKERQTIMRYLEVDDSQLWNMDKLLEVIEKKLIEIDRNRSFLEKQEDELQKEWKRLTSGEILELPQDFKEMLIELELHPVYGMNWIEKNGYSVEENRELVRKQPFIPYSLILPKAEMKKLELYQNEIYTSFPIPIIPREDLEKTLVEEQSSILNLQGISFYLWFNEKLLDEEALRVLIAQKEMEIKNKQNQILNCKTSYQEYLNKKSVLKNQSLTKEKLDANRNMQEEVAANIRRIEENMIATNEEIKELAQAMEELIQTILSEKQKIEEYRRREKEFEKFCELYNAYQNDIQDKRYRENDKERFEEKKRIAVSLLEKVEENRRTLETKINQTKAKISELNNRLIKYESYEVVENLEIHKRPEEIEARFEAITTKMSVQLQDLENQREKTKKNLNKAVEQLQRLQNRYLLPDMEWKDTIFNDEEQRHQEVLLEDRKRKLKIKERQWNEEDTKIAVLTSQIVDKKKGILEQCGYEEPMAKEEIHTIDFDARRSQLEYQKRELEKENKQTEEQWQSLDGNLSAFAEYSDFTVKKSIVWDEDFMQMNVKSLRDFAGIIRRDYRNETDEKDHKKNQLVAQLNILVRKEMYQEDYYKKPLEAMISVTEQAALVLAQIHTTVESYNSQMEKLAVDIAMVEKEKEKIEGLLEDYVKDVHSNMSKIDNNSTITIRERQIKMLRLQIPNWEENEGLYRQRLQDFMSDLTQTGISIYEKNENASDYFGTRITTKNLYDTVVGIGNIQIKLYKIEEQREYPITWAEVAKNSGGEGFLSAFVILSSLLHYMRRDDTDIFADRNEGKVLIMDNPFAQTNAAHLLKPLMDMAKKTNTQLICLSGLGGDSIYSRFDNIYVLNLVAASLRGGMQYLRGEHIRGTEEEIMVSSQIEVIEQQSLLF